PIGLGDVPGELRRKFVGESGRFLLRIQPKVDIWDRDGAERFIRELRTVDADVAGTPAITFEPIRYMERAYEHAPAYAFLLLGLPRVSFGLGLLLTLGMLATLGASLIVLPVLLRWTEARSTAEVLVLEPPPPKRAAA